MVNLLGIFIPPVGGIIMADYISRLGKYAELSKAKNADVCFVGLTAYIVGSASAFYSPMLSPLTGIIVAFVIYLRFYKLKNNYTKSVKIRIKGGLN